MSSRKMLRLIIVMAVLLVLVLAGYFLVDRSKQKQEDAEQSELDSLQLFSFSSEHVNTITFETKEGNFKIENVSGTWELTETDYPYDLKLNPYYINTVCANICILKADQKYSIEPDRLSAYGLDEPTVVTCHVGNTAYTLYVGAASATQECYYVMLPDDDTVYGISYEVGRLLQGDTSYLRSHSMIPYHETAITAYSIKRSALPDIVLDLRNNLWHMKEPLPDGNINSATVKSMLTNVTRVEVDGFVTAEKGVDLKPYGLDHPDYTLTVETEEESCVLQCAFAPEDNSNLYVLNEETGLISVISASAAGFLNTLPEELLNDTLLSVNFEDVAEVDVAVDEDIRFTMTMDHENGQYLLDDTDVMASGDNGFKTFRNLFDTVARISYAAMELNAAIPEDAEPACTFAFTMTDGKTTTLTLIESGEENIYWALLDGSYTGLTVRRRALTGNTGVLDFYERMTDILDNQ